MQALEMEEAESLVGSGRKRPINLPKTANGAGNGVLAAKISHRNFLTNVVAVAAGALLMLLYISMSDTAETSISTPNGVQMKEPTASPIEAPLAPTKISTPNPQPAPTSPPQPTEKPLEQPNSVPSTPASPIEASNSDSDPGNPVDDDDNDENGDQPHPINVYSKFATFAPLEGIPLADENKAKALKEKWGGWNFWDDDEDERPTENFYEKYPNGDVPNDEFPEGAWQTDAVFVNHYLNDAGQLVERAMEAIYAEYGYSSEGMSEQDLTDRSKKIFSWLVSDGLNDPKIENSLRKGKSGGGGFIPRKSQDGLVRRLLHAMMTSGTFNVVLCGHSVAAGSGNANQQNFLMQFHKVMAPIFARLGVELVSRNVAQGGLGTIQGSLGLQSIYGDELDLLLWDSGMTEWGTGHQDMVARQGALGKRVPVVMGLGMDPKLLTYLYDRGMDVGGFGKATNGALVTKSVSQAEQVPYAVRYFRCDSAMSDYCKTVPRFCWRCWLGSETVTPPTEQKEHFSDNKNFHPGWRELQMRGRSIAMMMLRALQEAIELWRENVQSGPPLDEDMWHVSDYYENIKKSLLNNETSFCHEQLQGVASGRVCDVPMRAYTEFSPRKDPHLTSIVSIAKPAPDGTKPKNNVEDILDGLDAPISNPCSELPDDAVDVYSIVSGGLSFGAHRILQESPRRTQRNHTIAGTRSRPRQLESDIVPGNGWTIQDNNIGSCDGTFNSRCHSGQNDNCLLSNYNSARGTIAGDEYSGWLVLEIDSIKEGIIVLKIDPFLKPTGEPIPTNWTSDTSGARRRQLKPYDIRKQNDNMIFEYAINGKVTSLPWSVFKPKLKRVQRTVYVFTLLDDNKFSGDNVEIAVRMRNCGRTCRYGVSHVYYA